MFDGSGTSIDDVGDLFDGPWTSVDGMPASIHQVADMFDGSSTSIPGGQSTMNEAAAAFSSAWSPIDGSTKSIRTFHSTDGRGSETMHEEARFARFVQA